MDTSKFMLYPTFFFACISCLIGLAPTAIHSSEAHQMPARVFAGVANEVYIVPSSNSGLHVLKISSSPSPEQTSKVESLLQIVRKAGISIPDSIIPPTLIEKKMISVLSYVEGHHITDENLPDVAKLMAQLHRIDMEHSALPPLRDYTHLFESCKDWEYCAPLQKVFDSLDLSYQENLPRGLIHGDFSYTNLLVDSKNRLTLLDWDLSRYDTLLTDVVRCQLFYGFDQDGNLKEETLRSFLLEYQKVRPLTSLECEVFYTHMKFYLIESALEMYYHLHVEKDLELDRVEGNPHNACLIPDLAAKKVFSVQEKTSIDLSFLAS